MEGSKVKNLSERAEGMSLVWPRRLTKVTRRTRSMGRAERTSRGMANAKPGRPMGLRD